jgi:hypothetical protein
MSITDYEICKNITDMQDNILGAGIIENLQVAAMYTKPKVPLPNKERFKLMFAQSGILVNIAKTNSDFFGRLRFIVCSFENSDIAFLPFTRSNYAGRKTRNSNNNERILVIQILRPYEMTELLKRLHIN